MIKETKNRYDIIVVGGGFAGLCAAIEAAKDANVLVLERKKEIGVPVNTVGAVHHKVIGKFGLEKFVDNYISGYRVHYPDGSEVTLKSKNFMGIMDVEAMLKELSQRAENQGAEVRVGENVKKVSFGTGSSIIETGNDKIHAKMVIGADGTASTVAKSLGLKWSNDELVILSQKELSDVYETDEDIIDVFYGENVSSNTYAAIYPKSNGNVSFGLGEKMGVNVKAKMDELSDNHPVISKYLRNSKTSVYARGIVPVFNKGRKSYGSCYLLAGDAAGQVNPHTGEGIEYAMLCGQMAGKVSGYAAKSGDFSEKKLKDYENMWGKEFGWQFRLAKMMRVPVSDRLLNKQSKIFRENDALRKIMAETLDEGRYSVMITKSLISPKALYGLIRMMI